MTTQQENKVGKKWLVLAIIIILLVINGIQLYMQNQSKQEIATQQVVIQKKDDSIKIFQQKVDSIKQELQLRYDEIAKLGGDTAALGEKIRTITAEKRKIAITKNNLQKLYTKLKTEYDSFLKNKDEEIVKLKEDRDMLFKENTGLKTTQVKLSDSISGLESKKEELAKQVKIAQILQVKSVKVTAITSKEKEIDDVEFKAKKIAKLKIAVEVSENKIAIIENKTFYMRLIEPSGNVLSDAAAGGGQFTVDQQNMVFTAKLETLYDQKLKTLQYIYVKTGEYALGKYQVEIYCEGALIGKGSFTVR